jgi:hypothetical protein
MTREAFLSRVTITPRCWYWKGTLHSEGYGTYKDGITKYAHRLAYELFVGPIPEGLQIDHVWARGCESRACVNPAHLEAVTQRENILRGNGFSARHARKTHCMRGHPLDGLAYRRNGKQKQQRYCRTCQYASNAAWRARKRAEERA